MCFLFSKWLVIDPDCITQQGWCQLHVSGKKDRLEGNFHRLGRRGCLRTVSADKPDRFADQSQFSRAFARDLGIAPGEYRSMAGVQRLGTGMFQNDKRCTPRMRKLRECDKAAREFARSNR